MRVPRTERPDDAGRRRFRRSGAVILAVVAVAALVTGCTSSGTRAGPASSGPASTAAPTTSSPPTTATATVTTTPTSASAAPTNRSSSSPPPSSKPVATSENCTNAQLGVRSRHGSGGAGGHGGVTVIFTNTSTSSCTLYGYPGAAAVDRSGHQFEQAKRTLDGYIAGCGCSHPARIRVAPGHSASTVVEGDHGGGKECLRGRTMLVAPPHAPRARSVAYLDSYSCDFQIHRVVAVTGGGGH